MGVVVGYGYLTLLMLQKQIANSGCEHPVCAPSPAAARWSLCDCPGSSGGGM